MLATLYGALLDRIAGLTPATACRLGAALGLLSFHFGVRRRVMADGLQRALGLSGQRRRAAARLAACSMGATFVELWTLHGDRAPARIMNPLWLAHLQAKPQGIVFLAVHLGNWDAAGAAVARGARHMVVYAKSQHDQVLDARLVAERQRSGMEVVFARHGGVAGAVGILRTLRRGGCLGLTADQLPPKEEGCAGYFLNVPTRLHLGPAVLARLSKSMIVPGMSVRSRSGENLLFIGRPIEQGPDDEQTTQRCMDVLGTAIAAFPGQYFWHHRRFKRPVDLPPRAQAPWRRGLRLAVDGGKIRA